MLGQVGAELEEPPAQWWSEDWGAGLAACSIPAAACCSAHSLTHVEAMSADSPKMSAQPSLAKTEVASLDASDDADSEQRLLSSPTSQIPPSPKPVLPGSCSDMVFRMPKGDRYAFGLARYLASLHVVMGHLNARGHALNVQPG